MHGRTAMEFIYVLQGRPALKVGTDQEHLDGDNSRYFDSLLPHG